MAAILSRPSVFIFRLTWDLQGGSAVTHFCIDLANTCFLNFFSEINSGHACVLKQLFASILQKKIAANITLEQGKTLVDAEGDVMRGLRK